MWNNIVNPKTGRKVNIQSPMGKNILNQYIQHFGGADQHEHVVDIKALWEWGEDELSELNDTLNIDNKYGIISPKIIINSTDDNIKGIYTYIAGGGGGAVYINDNYEIILKLVYSHDMYNNERRLQNLAGNIAPSILYNTQLDKLENKHIILEDDILEYWDWGNKEKVNSKIKKLVFMDNNPVNIIIMEYLNSSDWKPLTYITKPGYELTDEIKQNLKDTIKSLVYEKKIYNIADLVGYTGDHIFYNKDLNKFKVIDYGAFLDVGRKNKPKLVKDMLKNIYNKFKDLEIE